MEIASDFSTTIGHFYTAYRSDGKPWNAEVAVCEGIGIFGKIECDKISEFSTKELVLVLHTHRPVVGAGKINYFVLQLPKDAATVCRPTAAYNRGPKPHPAFVMRSAK